MTIIRPSIIQATYTDPFRGWTDSIAASGFQILMNATGMLHFVHTKLTTCLDLIPCDYVSNQILVQTVYTAREPKSKLNVVHVTTTSQNPLTMERMVTMIFDYVRY